MDPKIRDQLLSSDNYFFKGFVIFLLSSISFGVLYFVNQSDTSTNTTIIPMILSVSVLILVFIGPIYLILGFYKFWLSLDNNEGNIKQN